MERCLISPSQLARWVGVGMPQNFKKQPLREDCMTVLFVFFFISHVSLRDPTYSVDPCALLDLTQSDVYLQYGTSLDVNVDVNVDVPNIEENFFGMLPMLQLEYRHLELF